MTSSYPCSPDLSLVVFGDFACFTRPEMKVERVSYPVMTPTAARGLLEAIFWKPQFRWHIHEIWVLNPVRWFSIVRNELKNRVSATAAKSWAANGGSYEIRRHRTLRHTLALRDVRYLIRASIVAASRDQEIAFRAQFARRLAHGACFHRPYMGCREFAANFLPASGNEQPIQWDEDLGLMLWNLSYEPGDSGRATPQFFAAVVRNGILCVPIVPEEAAQNAA